MPNEVAGLCLNCMTPLGEYIICPHCGYDKNTPHDPDALPPGTMVGGKYLIGRSARKNGEGITYTALDREIHARVWIREYYPRAIAHRDAVSGTITAKSGFGAQYKALMSDFVDMYTQVHRLNRTEPVVPVEHMFSGFGTAYAVSPDLSLIPFETWLTRQGGKLPAAEACELLLPVFHCLSNLHAQGVIHRGISPYTIYVDSDGKPYLWDFCLGAARTAGSELDAELFNGYSAPEQYTPTGWQGTWTDVYGAAALFYRVVSGFVPPKSTMIGPQRPLSPLSDLAMDLPDNISEAVHAAMSIDTEGRTQEIDVFAAQLVHTDLSSTAIYDVHRLNKARIAQDERHQKRAEARQQRKYLAAGLLITVVVLALAFWFVTTHYLSDLITPDSPSSSSGSVADTSPDSSGLQSQESVSQSNALALPSLVGKTVAEVQDDSEYQSRQIQFVIKEDYSDRYEAGIIFDQSPAAGVSVANGRTVILYVSKGPSLLVMPDLIGKESEEVNQVLAELGGGKIDLTFSTYTKYVEGAEPGTVISTTPAAGEEFDPKNTRIAIFYQRDDVDVNEASQVDRDSSSRRGDGPDRPVPRR